jgi:hypothetical protein
MLDTPNFFWDSEPTLHPLYTAVREYLEIKPRIQVLNERCQVFLDLGEILSDSISDKKMTRITWIIIVLIILSICITCLEVSHRMVGRGGEQCTSSSRPFYVGNDANADRFFCASPSSEAGVRRMQACTSNLGRMDSRGLVRRRMRGPASLLRAVWSGLGVE